MATRKHVIPAKAGIQKFLRILDSGLRGSDKEVSLRVYRRENGWVQPLQKW